MAENDSTYQITGKFTGVDEIVSGYKRIDASVKQVAGSIKAMADLNAQTVAKSQQSSTAASGASKQRVADLKNESALVDLVVAGYDRLSASAKTSQAVWSAQLDSLRRNVGTQLGSPAGSSILLIPSGTPATASATMNDRSGLEAETVGVSGKDFIVKASVVNLSAESVNLAEKSDKSKAGDEKNGDQRIIEELKKSKELVKHFEDGYKETKEYYEKIKQLRDALDKVLGVAVPTSSAAATGIAMAGSGAGEAAATSAAGAAETTAGVAVINSSGQLIIAGEGGGQLAAGAGNIIRAGATTTLDGVTYVQGASGLFAPEGVAAGVEGAAAGAEGAGLTGIAAGGAGLATAGLFALPIVAIGGLISNQIDKNEMEERKQLSAKNITKYSDAFADAIPGMNDDQIRATAEAVQNRIVLEQVAGLSLERSGKGSFASHFGLDQASEFNKTLAWASGKENLGIPEAVNEMGKHPDQLKPEEMNKSWDELKQPLALRQLVGQLKSFNIPQADALKLFLDTSESQLDKHGLGDLKDTLESGAREAYPKLMEQIDKGRMALAIDKADALDRAKKSGITVDETGVHGTFSTAPDGSAPAGAAPGEGHHFADYWFSRSGSNPASTNGVTFPAWSLHQGPGGTGLPEGLKKEMGVLDKKGTQVFPSMTTQLDRLGASAATSAGTVNQLANALGGLKPPSWLPGQTPGTGTGSSGGQGSSSSGKRDPFTRYSSHPNHAEGGLVKRDHIAGVHEGELITRAPDVSRLVAAAANGGTGGRGHTVNVTVSGGGDGREIARLVARAVSEALDDQWTQNRRNTEALKDRTLMV